MELHLRLLTSNEEPLSVFIHSLKTTIIIYFFEMGFFRDNSNNEYKIQSESCQKHYRLIIFGGDDVLMFIKEQ